ncbi:MAG TPA: TadE family type IV pilus minor pilin [Nocardioidaceae bacterium]|nr:TadE family type IV pilus minor pilin [Nocardioidaceae bacterium]
MSSPMSFVVEGARRWRAPARAARGAAAAETAALLPVLGSMVIGAVWLLSLAVTQVLVVDSAREAARAAARGDGDRAVVAAGEKVAPRNAQFSVRRHGSDVIVEVEARVAGLGGLFAFLPLPTAKASATASVEER